MQTMRNPPISPRSIGRAVEPLVDWCQVLFISIALILHLSANFNRSLTSIPLIQDPSFGYPLQVDEPNKNSDIDIPVFYNVFVANQSEHGRVLDLATNQLSELRSYHSTLYVHSNGYPLSVPNATTTQHHTNGTEITTLQKLWQYCQRQPQQKVIYVHSKGSYHPSKENDIMRQLLTKGALSEQCAKTSPSTCNVCSYRFAPFPHPHTPGNMWLAHCSYVKDLIAPVKFIDDMEDVYKKLVTNPTMHESCVGKGRWAAEHWVHSHPSAKPCDLYTNDEFAWGYDGLAEYKKGDFDLRLAPRYRVNDWPLGCDFSDLQHRLKEYRLLYNMTPSQDWWGWNFWLGQNHDPILPVRRRRRPKKMRLVETA